MLVSFERTVQEMSSSRRECTSTSKLRSANKEKKIISSLLHKAILSLCQKSYSSAALEVDGIICISALDSGVQDVVKIHEMLNTGEYSDDVPEEQQANTSWYSVQREDSLLYHTKKDFVMEDYSSTSNTDRLVDSKDTNIYDQPLSATLSTAVDKQGLYTDLEQHHKQEIASKSDQRHLAAGAVVSDSGFQHPADRSIYSISDISHMWSMGNPEIRGQTPTTIANQTTTTHHAIDAEDGTSTKNVNIEYTNIPHYKCYLSTEEDRSAQKVKASQSPSIAPQGSPSLDRSNEGVIVKVEPKDKEDNENKPKGKGDNENNVYIDSSSFLDEEKHVSNPVYFQDSYVKDEASAASTSEKRIETDATDNACHLNLKTETDDNEMEDEKSQEIPTWHYMSDMQVEHSKTHLWPNISETPFQTQDDSEYSCSGTDSEADIELNSSGCTAAEWNSIKSSDVQGATNQTSQKDNLDKLKESKKTGRKVLKKHKNSKKIMNRSTSPTYTSGSLVDRLPFISFQELFPQTSPVACGKDEDHIFPVQAAWQSSRVEEGDQMSSDAHGVITRLASGSKTRVLYGGLDLDQDIYDDEEEDEELESDGELVDPVPSKKPRLGVPRCGKSPDGSGKARQADPSRLIPCYVCGLSYSKSYIMQHLWKQHAIKAASNNTDTVSG